MKSDTLQHPNLLMLLLMFIIKLRENLSIKKSEILLLQKLSDSSETRKLFPKLLIFVIHIRNL